jgi:hypothetical protein
MVPAWPPRWAPSLDSGDAWDTTPKAGEGVLESIMLLEASTLLRLTMKFEAQLYTGLLSLDPPPLLNGRAPAPRKPQARDPRDWRARHRKLTAPQSEGAAGSSQSARGR